MILSKHAFRRSLFEPFKMFYSPGGLQNVLCLEGRGKAYLVEVQWFLLMHYAGEETLYDIFKT